MKLLIADDEVQIREGLAEGLNWKDAGIDRVFCAENGVRALEICRSEHPEVILTDIRMPGIDGIELTRQVCELYSPVRVIVLSGYSEFSYAQASLKLGVADYLLKPVNIDELLGKVRQCCAAIESERSEKHLRSEYTRQQCREAVRALLEKDDLLGVKDTEQLSSLLGASAAGTWGVVCVSPDSAGPEGAGEVVSLACSQLEKLPSQPLELFVDDRGVYLLCSAFMQQKAQSRLREWQTALNGWLRAQLDASVSLALGDAGTLNTAGLSLKQCRMALNHRLYTGAGAFLVWTELKSRPGFGGRVPLPREELLGALTQRRGDLVQGVVHRLFEEYRTRQITAEEPLQAACLELEYTLWSVLDERGIAHEDFGGIPAFCTVQQAEAWAQRLCENIFGQLQWFAGRPCSREVMQVADHIVRHYAEDFSLEQAATSVGRSKSYFSTQFKKEMGVSFVDYLNQVRIAEACRQLERTGDLTYEVAERVGFGDYKYFSRLFKKQVGCSPAHYRRRLAAGLVRQGGLPGGRPLAADTADAEADTAK